MLQNKENRIGKHNYYHLVTAKLAEIIQLWRQESIGDGGELELPTYVVSCRHD